MNSPKIDRKSFALHKKHIAKVRTNAEREAEKRGRRMSTTERTKLGRLIKNIEYLGDVGKAAGRTRVSRALLDKWMNTPGISWQINTAFNAALRMSFGGVTAEDILFRARVAPELRKDSDHFKKTGHRRRESKVIAKRAATNLKQYRWQIVQAATNRDKHFFIDLGRILSGEASAELYDKLDQSIANLYMEKPAMNTGEVVTRLEGLGHSEVNEATVRQRKKRLGLSKSITANRDKTSSSAVTIVSASKGNVDASYDSSNTNPAKSGHRPRKR